MDRLEAAQAACHVVRYSLDGARHNRQVWRGSGWRGVHHGCARKVGKVIGLLLLILFAGVLGYLVYLVALKISHDSTIAGIIGLVVFLLILLGGWGRAGGAIVW
jgi:hypothetical protein